MNFFYFLYCNCNLLSLKITFNKMFTDLCKLSLPLNLHHTVDQKFDIQSQIKYILKANDSKEEKKRLEMFFQLAALEEELRQNCDSVKKARQNLVFLIHFLKFIIKVVEKERPLIARKLLYFKNLKNNFVKIRNLLPNIQKNLSKFQHIFEDVFCQIDLLAFLCKSDTNSYFVNIISVFESIWLEWDKYTLVERKEKNIDVIYKKLLYNFLTDSYFHEILEYEREIHKSFKRFLIEYFLIN
ncbi:hypothetical protein TUBRATIS_25830 [Tubulinosema ratisbonensis]|uniref:Uncharacterized protein n=1 Tax=Tubulinosema ratisbonensis TaxID=291195 RepID=A0A437AIL9_9MICR|nr:hypothetical protein TUBRATIS_25830 [Tubulinosema ratisbonensis]